jgi:phage repressor protein C with HTH and peptisase S24 domain
MTPNDDAWLTEDAVDLLVTLVGRIAFDHMDPLDPRNARFLDWLAREARLNQSHSDRQDTERRAGEFVERVLRRRQKAQALDRSAVECVEESPKIVSVPESSESGPVPRAGYAPLWDLAVAAGTGRELWDEPAVSFIKVPEYLPAGRYIALAVTGDSMAPLLRTGDTILVRLGHDLRRDRVVVARHPERGYVVKRVGQATSARVELESFNADYPAIHIPNDASLILGTVVLRWRGEGPRR